MVEFSGQREQLALAILGGLTKRANATTAADQLKVLAEALARLAPADIAAVSSAFREAYWEAYTVLGSSLLRRASATTAHDQLELLSEAYAALAAVEE